MVKDEFLEIVKEIKENEKEFDTRMVLMDMEGMLRKAKDVLDSHMNQ